MLPSFNRFFYKDILEKKNGFKIFILYIKEKKFHKHTKS
jgi:hypothetical protein